MSDSGVRLRPSPRLTFPAAAPTKGAMIHIGIHTDNYRPLSVGFEGACQKIAATGLKHIEFAAIHGQNFIAALGYDPGVSLQSNPRALRRFLDKLGLRVSQIDGSYPMMGPNGSDLRHPVRHRNPSASPPSWAAPWWIPWTARSRSPGFTRKEVFRITCDNYRQMPLLGRGLQGRHQRRAPRPLHQRH